MSEPSMIVASEPALYYPKPAILDEIPRCHHAVIEASAGTGKTYTIEHLVVELLLDRKLSLDQILVLTFTEKAAGELKVRLRRILERVLHERKPQQPDGPYWRLTPDRLQRLEHALINFDTASIFTIHAFFQSVLAQYAFESGRLFSQTLVDGKACFHEAFGECLRTQFAVDGTYLPYLKCWLTTGNGSVDSLENHLWGCHSCGAKILPEYDEDRLQKLLAAGPSLDEQSLARLDDRMQSAKVHGRTRKAIVEKLHALQQVLQLQGKLPMPEFLLRLNNIDYRYFLKKRSQDDACHSALPDVFEWMCELSQQAVDLRVAVTSLFLPPVQKVLQERKLADGSIDFDDMIANVWETLRSPHGQPLLEQLRSQYRVAIVDEFQDTDDDQWLIFRRLFLDSNGENLLYVIGDPKQAIYGFRGADVQAYLRAKHTILGASNENKLVALRDNYRSSARLIDAYNQIFDQRAEPPFFAGAIDYKNPVQCGVSEYRLLDANSNDAASCVVWELEPSGDKVATADVRRTFASQISKEIHRLLNDEQGRLLLVDAKGDKRLVRPRDIFVLTLTNREARQVGDQLRALGIPHAFYKQEGLFQSSEATDVRDLLASIVDPQDRSKRCKAWLTPFFAVGLEELSQLNDVPESSELNQRLLAWQQLAAKEAFGPLFDSILSESGIIRREILLADGERALTNYQHLFDLLLEEASQRAYNLEGLVRLLNRWISGEEKPTGENGNMHRLESDRDAVQLMTMHKSKGLEAAVVFLFGGFTSNNGKLCTYHEEDARVVYLGKDSEAKAKAKAEEREENQRLLYVAVTRAKYRLYLPLVRSDCWSQTPTGPYQCLADRLERMLRTDDGGELFERIAVKQVPAVRQQEQTQPVDLSQWTPPPELLQVPDRQSEMRRLRYRHRPFTVTSYTSLHKQVQVERDKEAEREDFEHDAPLRGSLIADTDLPGGAQTGTFLHAILETVDPGLFQHCSFEDWRQREEISELVRRNAVRHAIDSRFLESAFQIVFRSMTHTLQLGSTKISGLWSSPRIAREIEFLFPIPEADHPKLSDPELRVVHVRKGYVKGFVDFVFEHEGKIYFLDWKSNVLPSYDLQTIKNEVQRDYDLQIRLYSIAMMKLLEIHDAAQYENRFGGLVYVFLRGLQADPQSQAGVYFHRPAWTDVLQFESDLAAQRI